MTNTIVCKSCSFEKGTVLYQETVTEAIEGVGHFEPLRHYSECHLLIEPGKQGSGLQFAINCSVDVLGHNYQQQIMTALKSKLQRGVLIGAPLTDAKITLVGGRASVVHSVGGDFREAANRALRQGLMELKQKAACQLLEPWYRFTLLVPNDQVGRALNDIQRASGDFDAPAPLANNQTQITGHAPVSENQACQRDSRLCGNSPWLYAWRRTAGLRPRGQPALSQCRSGHC